MASLPPLPYKVPPISPTGYLSDTWAKWFQDMFNRIGGTSSLSNAELEAAVLALQTLTASHTTSITILNGELDHGPTL